MLRFIRPMLVGMIIGSLGKSFLSSKSFASGAMGFRIRRALGLVNLMGRELSRAARKA